MVNHFTQFGNTMCRNCALGWGIYLLIDSIYVLARLRGMMVTGGIIVLLIGLGLLSCWAGITSRDRKSAAALRERERAALEIAGGVVLYAPAPT
jgi:hypothetical protein